MSGSWGSFRSFFLEGDMEKYHIGNVDFVWKEGNFPLKIDNYMRKFLKEDLQNENNEEIIYETCIENLEAYSKGNLLQMNGLYELYQFPEGEFIIYHWATCRFAFGFWMDDLEKGNMVRCYFSPEMYNQIPLDAVRFFSCAGMHSKLLQKNALVFHSSYIEWKGKAILFAGASGTGKSTQAKLWETHANAQIINGDRTLIRKKDDIWMAYGYPCCGSSLICINKTLPIALVVILEQGTENKIEVIDKKSQIRAILTGSEAYRWKLDEIDSVCQIARGLVDAVPVIKFVCKKDKNAVNVLKEWMEGREDE